MEVLRVLVLLRCQVVVAVVADVIIIVSLFRLIRIFCYFRLDFFLPERFDIPFHLKIHGQTAKVEKHFVLVKNVE